MGVWDSLSNQRKTVAKKAHIADLDFFRNYFTVYPFKYEKLFHHPRDFKFLPHYAIPKNSFRLFVKKKVIDAKKAEEEDARFAKNSLFYEATTANVEEQLKEKARSVVIIQKI